MSTKLSYKTILFASVAAIALSGCGSKDSSNTSSGSAASSVSKVASLNASSGSPFDKAYSLKGASTLDVDALFASLGYTGEKFYSSSSFDEKSGATTINNISITGDEGSIVTIAKAELYGVSTQAIESVKSNTGSFDAPFLSVFEKIRLHDIAITAPRDAGREFDKLAITFSGIEADKLQIREGGLNLEADEATYLAQAMNMLDLGGLYFKDINFDLTSEENLSLKLTSPDYRIVGFGGGKLNGLIANDLEYELVQSRAGLENSLQAFGPDAGDLLNGPLGSLLGFNGQRIKVGSIKWLNIDGSGLLPFGLNGKMPPMSEKNILSLGSAVMTDIEQYVGEKKLYSAKSANFIADKFTWLIPNNVTANVKDANYDFTAYLPDGEDELLGIMTKYGLNDVDGDGEMLWNYDDKNGTSRFNYAFNTDKLLDLDLVLNSDNLKYDEIATLVANEDQPGILGLGTLNNFKLVLKDKNALNMAFDIAAIQMGASSGDEIRSSAPALLRLGGGQFTQLNPKYNDYIDALASFIGSGGTLEITADPEGGLPFSQLSFVSQSPETLPDLLGLKVTRKK